MNIHGLMACVISLWMAGTDIANGDDNKKPPVKKEQEKLAGTWVVVAVESNGRKAADEDVKDLRYVFKVDGTWRLEKNGQAIAEGTYKIDLSTEPAAIDYKIISSVSEQDKGKSSLGIYMLEGDTLKVCRAWPGQEQRPGEFSAGGDSKRILSEFKREKP